MSPTNLVNCRKGFAISAIYLSESCSILFVIIIISALGPWHPQCLTHYCMLGKVWIAGFLILDLHLLEWLCMLRPMYRGKNHIPLSRTDINSPCQSNLSDKIFTETGAVSLIPKKDNTRQLYHFISTANIHTTSRVLGKYF